MGKEVCTKDAASTLLDCFIIITISQLPLIMLTLLITDYVTGLHVNYLI